MADTPDQTSEAASKGWLSTITGISQKTWNTILSVGPFLISQSDKASEAFQRHLGRVAEADALSELLQGEVKLRMEMRQKLFDKLFDAPLEERVRIEQDIEYIDGFTRQLRLAEKSVLHSNPEPQSPSSPPAEKVPIAGNWLDRYNELARKRNEEWRGELLARALARESESPGSVNPRALWLIGNMEEELFIALSELLDLCVWQVQGNVPFIPSLGNGDVFEIKVGLSGQKLIGSLAYSLQDIGVLSDHLSSTRTYPANLRVLFRYGHNGFIVTQQNPIVVRGILMTGVGVIIAQFCQPRPNPQGQKVFNNFIEQLKMDGASTVPVVFPEQRQAASPDVFSANM